MSGATGGLLLGTQCSARAKLELYSEREVSDNVTALSTAGTTITVVTGLYTVQRPGILYLVLLLGTAFTHVLRRHAWRSHP